LVADFPDSVEQCCERSCRLDDQVYAIFSCKQSLLVTAAP